MRIVGLKTTNNEDCIKMATKVFEEVGVSQCKIERAHRDGKIVRNRDRHVLVKLSFYQDKVAILKRAREALVSKDYYIIDDLTQMDLIEKRRWSEKVKVLYQRGTRLRFSGGYWRGSDGRPFKFQDVINVSDE